MPIPFVSVPSSPGGADTNLQYNNAGDFGGFADGTAHQLLHGGRTFGAVDQTSEIAGVTPPANGGVASITAANLGGFTAWGLLGPQTAANNNIVITSGVSANSVKVVQFVLPIRITIKTAKFWIGTAGASGKFAYTAIYDSGKNKLFQAQFSCTSTSTVVTDTSFGTITLDPGVYYYAVSCDSATPNSDTQTPGLVTAGNLYQSSGARIGTAANSLSGTTMPATLGVITGASVSVALGFFEA